MNMATEQNTKKQKRTLLIAIVIVTTLILASVIIYAYLKINSNKKIPKNPTDTITKTGQPTKMDYNNIDEPLQAGAQRFAALDLHDSDPIEINNNIAKFTHLTDVYLQRDKLKEIPDGLLTLTNLTTLWLPANEIESISPQIANLRKLKIINLNGNKIRNVPPEIGELANLEELSLGGNLLKALPKEISNLRKLKKLYLNLNQIPEIEQTNIKRYLEGIDVKIILNDQLTPTPTRIPDNPKGSPSASVPPTIPVDKQK